ncbi:MAG: hypothetical protein E5Y59_02980 [Mesorhizobium sp.]|uniref:hypothetical protein n=1 Tax=Mesorhizobium sp. TaxID=1871066 RepID=UPI001201C772|nr:hypothetical protein [Mesorhizobium sp.]TIL70370.1 MAG: hypothetical protein E5Y70_31280 [Mesorhizobium sp.]TIN20828.1 MAG: hypothetical protein E5Y59_02980 [Mesorhizobium sp.]
MGISLTHRKPVVGTKSKQRSRIGNGTDLLPDMDGRSAIARRIRELLSELIKDMGGDPSSPKLVIAKRAAVLAAWCECAEAKLAKDDTALDIGTYTTAINTLRRLLTDIGLERKAKDITPSLRDYAATQYAGAAS